MEKDLFVRLGLCVSPFTAEASGISRRALESMGVGVTDVHEKERSHRTKLRNKILKDILPYQGDVGLLPGLGLHKNILPSKQKTILIPEKELVQVSTKVIKGCEYILGKRVVESPNRVEVYFCKEEQIGFVTDLFEHLPEKYLGPGFQVSRGVSDDDSRITLYRVVIWGSIKVYASIGSEEYFAMIKDLTKPL